MRVILFANTEWYLYNFRRSLARCLTESGFAVVLVSPPGPYGERLEALGHDWRAAPMTRRSLNPLRELRLLLWLVRLFRKEQPAVVHGFTLKCAIYGSLAAKLAGVPARVNAVAGLGYVFTSRDRRARLLRWPVRQLMRFAFSGAGSAVVVQNADDRARLRAEGGVGERAIHVIPGSGVATEVFGAVVHRPCPDGVPRIVLAARMLVDKGVAEFVEAARRLRERGIEGRFRLAGAPDVGNPAAIPVARLEAWADEGVVEWLGHVDDMPGLLAETDIMVLPSYREGLPRSLIEAAAAGIPLVTTDVPGCRAVVRHEVDGLVVPVRDPQALADAIRRLLEDPALAARLAAAAKARARREFDEKMINRATLEVYRALLGGAPAWVEPAGRAVPMDRNR